MADEGSEQDVLDPAGETPGALWISYEVSSDGPLPQETLSLRLGLRNSSTGLNRGVLRREVERIGMSASTDSEQLAERLKITVKKSLITPGGGAPPVEVLELVAAIGGLGGLAGGVLSNAVWDGLKALGRKIHGRLDRADTADEWLEELEAIGCARMEILVGFGVDPDELTQLSYSFDRSSGTASVVLRADDGSTFVVTLDSTGAMRHVVRSYAEKTEGGGDDLSSA
ncbi:hypothetical protein F0Q45_11105 [Mycobacterium simiae]|uniref:Uncharacterized protein n=1 Tax=Mycobacterium simiae TaxID=1784 RepID=A0A5B1BRZ2_MYCSI|nr:hypothetical protein [Mycobacterium simiae]KAA1250180.1 hypothetical protein F0Q45_11105 [Mycobacterium simiae]